ncbi:MAG: hypothetical protein AAF735_07495 [Myxococcota bacterium]
MTKPPELALRRFFYEAGDLDRLVYDETGLLDAQHVEHMIRADALLLSGCAFVTAPPWMGKTHAAKAISFWLRKQKQLTVEAGGVPRSVRFELTQLGAIRANDRVLPEWWNEWLDSDEVGVWVVDSFDEGVERDPALFGKLTHALCEELPSQAAERLRLVVFSRDYPLLHELKEATEDAGLGPRRYTLAPLDAQEAQELIAPMPLDELREFIGHCDLQSVAGLPVVLKHIKRLGTHKKLSASDVWKSVLNELICEPNPFRKEFTTELEDRFDATARMAACMLLGDIRVLRDSNSGATPYSLADVFDTSERPLRTAAREAWRSGVFSSLDGGRVFSQRHTQERFAAYALRPLRISKLRPLLADDSGHVLPGLQGLCAVLRELSPNEDVCRWLDDKLDGVETPSDLVPWKIADVCRFVDRLEKAADRSTLAIRGDENSHRLKMLAVPGAAEELENRIADKSRSTNARRLLLDVLFHISRQAGRTVSAAIATSSDYPMPLRISAAWNLYQEADVQFAEDIGPPPYRFGRTDADAGALTALFLMIRRKFRISSVDEYLQYAPTRERGFVDAAAVLHAEVKTSLTREEASVIVERMVDEDSIYVHNGAALESLFPEAVSLLLGHPELSDREARLLIDVAQLDLPDTWHEINFQALQDRLCAETTTRRQFFEAASRRVRGSEAWNWSVRLRLEDLDWLLSLAKRTKPPAKHMYEEALLISWVSAVSDDIAAQVRSLADEAFPGLSACFNEQVLRAEARRARQKKNEHKQSKRLVSPTLESSVNDILNSGKAIDEQMRELGHLCFSPTWTHQADALGEWDDLPEDTQRRVEATCREGLVVAKPTSIADRGVSGLLVSEAFCFQHLVLFDDHSWIDGIQIKKWLPVLLHVSVEDADAIVLACAAIDRDATEEVLDSLIRSEARESDGQLYRSRRIPSRAWSATLSATARSLLEDTATDDRTRGALLHLLADQDESEALSIAPALAKAAPDVSRELRLAAIDCWLMLSPSAAWSDFLAVLRSDGCSTLAELTSMTSERRNWLYDLGCVELTQLAIELFRFFPPDRYGYRAGYQSHEDRLIYLRDSVLRLLIQREPESSDGLDELAKEFEYVSRVVAFYRSSAAVDAIAAEVTAPPMPGLTLSDVWQTPITMLPLKDIVRTLVKANYHALRTVDDLLATVAYAIDETIQGTLGRDIELLFEGNKERRQRRPEAVLQAYLHARLEDLLPDQFLSREAQVSFLRRPDLQVSANLTGGRMGRIMIELKWVDHRDVCQSLETQLGQKYLLEEKQTHGIYFVGWLDGATPNGYTRLSHNRPESADDLRTLLSKQAARFVADHPKLRIHISVCDCTWRC